MVMKFLEVLRENPVIASVRKMRDLEYALKKKIRVIFLRHLDLIRGIARDQVGILPGIILPYIRTELDKLHLPPIVAGGLIKTRGDVDRILASGAVAVSTSRRELW